ncbi:MAG: hypothetical protein AAGH65_11170, partial [Pseudomonadota bacterium]
TTVTWDNVDTLWVREDFEVGRTSLDAEAGTDIDITGTASLPNMSSFTVSEGRLRVGGVGTGSGFTADANITGRMDISGATMSVDDYVQVGFWGFSNTFSEPAASQGVTIDGELIISNGSLTTPITQIATTESGEAATITGRLALNPSYLNTNLLQVGEGGTVVLEVGGTTPASVMPGPGSYSQIDALEAQINGTVEVVFGPLIPGGDNTFELLRVSGPLTLGPNAEFVLMDPPPGVEVNQFEVIDVNGTSILTLGISGGLEFTPIAVNHPVALLLLILSVLGVAMVSRRLV